MLEGALFEMSSAVPGEYLFGITAEERAFSFADLREHLECVSEIGARIGDMGLKKMAEVGTMPVLGKMLIEADKIMDY